MWWSLFIGSVLVVTALPVFWWGVLAGPAASQLGRVNLQRGRGGQALVDPDVRAMLLARPARERTLEPFIELLARIPRRLTPAGVARGLERRVRLAGVEAKWPAERLLATKLLTGGAGTLLALVRFAAGPSRANLLFGILVVAVGYFGPDLVLMRAGSSRQRAIRLEMPDTFDQIMISVEAGLGFEAAMSRVARVGQGPLAQELVRTLQDMQLGLSRTDALHRMCDRTDVSELRHFVVAVAQSEAYGVPIAQILRIQAGELREKRRQRAEEAAMKIPVKVIFPLVLFILPTLFIIVIGPAVLRVAGSGL